MSSENLGRIKWFNNRKGFGFLTDCDSNEDIFVHFSAIQTPDKVYKALIEGEYVQYQPGTDKSGKSVALNVTGVRGGPLLCENKERRIYSVKRETDEDGENRQPRRQGRRQGRQQGRQQGRRYERRQEPERASDSVTQEEVTGQSEEAEMAQIQESQ